MKKLLLLSAFGVFALSCNDDTGNAVTAEEQNKILLLKVDAETNAFEGGKELAFEDAEDFTIGVNYNPPGDFGDISLTYEEVDAPIFAGTIIWMGLGEMSYPEAFNGPDSFATIENPVLQPSLSEFELVAYDDSMTAVNMDFGILWNAIDNLQLVKDYRDANPEAKIYLYLYTPSVGIGNPAEWDWIILLKN